MLHNVKPVIMGIQEQIRELTRTVLEKFLKFNLNYFAKHVKFDLFICYNDYLHEIAYSNK